MCYDLLPVIKVAPQLYVAHLSCASEEVVQSLFPPTQNNRISARQTSYEKGLLLAVDAKWTLIIRGFLPGRKHFASCRTQVNICSIPNCYPYKITNCTDKVHRNNCLSKYSLIYGKEVKKTGG